MDNIKDRVIIIREQDELVASCCVPFDGEFVREFAKVDLFPETTAIIRTTGEFYQRLKEEYGDSIDVDVVDPRNQGYLFPRLIKDVFRYRVSIGQGLKTIFALRSPAVVCNGRLIMSGNKQLSVQVFDKVKQIIKVA
ncbi:MAG: hypothetical protein APF84_02310 [Gracilibacter sp. BRH_c7a]|nr:MAG: hypothetical protein APF84_02310 [Gracilibacter sp. BRH_c7a]